MKIKIYSRGAIYALFNYDRENDDIAFALIARSAIFDGAKKVIEIYFDQRVPSEFMAEFIRHEFNDPMGYMVSPYYEWWNRSYHDPETLPLGSGRIVIGIRRRKVKHIFSRLRRAVNKATEAWRSIHIEAVKAHLVRKGVWAREGD